MADVTLPQLGETVTEGTITQWFKSVGDEEAHLLQIAGYPRGAKASKRIPVEPAKAGMGGLWIGMTDEEKKIRAPNNRL